jgi:signal transduction histidine kinase/ActR/RegA family two-component response regulator
MSVTLSTYAKKTHASLDLKRMHLNPFSLRFSGPCAYLEDTFQREYLEKSLKHIRVALILAVILYAAFGVLDAILIPGKKHLTWMIRYAFVCPAMLLVLLLSRFRIVQRRIQPILAGLIVIGGAGIITMILVAPPPVNYSYYAGLILIFMLGFTFIRAQFIWASLGAWCLVVLYEIAAIGISKTPVPVLINNNFFFISAIFIGMVACYSIELYARRDFFLVQLLAAEQENVRSANRALEQRVETRTAQLERINRELAFEIKERKHAETERIRLADQLKQAEKMEAIGSMAAGVAHDLNNILSGLVSYPELLLMDLPEDSSLRETVLTIKKSGDKAAAIVQDLLTMARRGVADKKVVNPNQLVNDYLGSPEFLNLKRQHPHVRFRTRLDADLLNVAASPVHLSKALMNLVSNAVEALLVDGEVSITTVNRCVDQPLQGYETVAEGDYAVLGVSDNGVGIGPQDLQQIFEPFFTKKRMGHAGTGLGMSVVWATVKDLGGYIDIRSREGQGTAFSLYLPITRREGSLEGTRVTFDDYRGTERVLVVDDLAEQREIAASMLGKLGYHVDAVVSGEEALVYLEKNTADIIVLDMIMEPGIDGCETYRRIVERHPHQKAIVASGFSESERVREIQRIGAGAYLKKPYTLEKIGMAVRGELDRVRLDLPSA